ncbi:alpha/beta hydrolase [Streptomyces sp. NPDC001941]|uniref:alpha/beta fold hydrolase n=1 Tax=Streptomyces sp. NPDC001941 TaxID=3154659 RepID=UPI0033241C7A
MTSEASVTGVTSAVPVTGANSADTSADTSTGASTEASTGAYADRGSGEVLLLVHGHPFDHTMWAPQLEEFAATHRVVAPDLRGYGNGPAPVADRTLLGDFAHDVVALADRLGAERFVLGGLSMGGQIVMEVLRLFPERVRAVVLADTFPAAETAGGRALRNSLADRFLAEGPAGVRAYADEVLEKMVAPYAPAEVKARVHRMMTGTSPAGAAAALRGRAERPDYRELLARTTVPALVVVGRDDAYTPVADAEAMHAALADSTLVVVEGAAHMPNLERPAEFNAALRAFLDRIG